MNEKVQWNQTFADHWRHMRSLDKRYKREPVVLTAELAQAARMFRDKGQDPAKTARGLYLGTQAARGGHRG